MRLFQNAGLYPAYLARLACLTAGKNTFNGYLDAFLADRYGACHVLLPVMSSDKDAFFTNGDDEKLQRLWANENGLPAKATMEEILLAQIEQHHTEIFYNLDPMRYGNDFLQRLPGCVKYSIAWRAAPSPGADFRAYDRVICNFPSILQSYRDRGWKTAYLAPAHDPVMDTYAANEERPIDVLFVGGYSRHHKRRAEILEAVARLAGTLNVRFHLDRSRLTKLAEGPVGRWLPLTKHRRPFEIRAVSAEPIFGLDLYSAISRAKIVLNGAVDMAGEDRGNMRCFEAMGCGALMISDDGKYPDGLQVGINMITYRDARDAVEKIEQTLADPARTRAMALEGIRTMQSIYSKEAQWHAFQKIVEAL